MFDGMHNIFKETAGYNSTYHHRMGWVVEVQLFSLKTLLYFTDDLKLSIYVAFKTFTTHALFSLNLTVRASAQALKNAF